MKRFKVQHYKRITDSGWIDVNDMTAFVGKNEVGKSSIFRALSKLNPSDNECFSKLEELPHKQYTELKNETIYPISVEFELSQDEFASNTPDQHTLIAKKSFDNDFYFEIDGKKITSEKKIERITKCLPSFIYFDNYYKLNGKFNISDFLDKYSSDPNNRQIRAQKCMFDYVGLDPKELHDLGDDYNTQDDHKQMKARERKILCDSAAAKMTKEFKNWWRVRDYKFDYRIDGDNFGVYVSDDIDPTSIELDQRSSGLVYFFSFFLIFTTESNRLHENSILLLDEPGLHYHATFQLELINFFKELSSKNQILYSTHSPFLVDNKNLDDVKIVYEDQETKAIMVSTNVVWPRDAEILFPLKISWWNSVYQTYLQDKIHLLVEGTTDFEILTEINKVLLENRKTGLDSDIAIIPGGGNRTGSLISILKASNIKQFYFLDGDDTGITNAKNYSTHLGIRGITTNDFCKFKYSTLEDLIPSKIYQQAVKDAYNLPNLTLDPNTDTGMIVSKIKNYLQKNDLEIDKIKINQELLQLIHDNSKEICAKFEPIFAKINSIKQEINSQISSHKDEL